MVSSKCWARACKARYYILLRRMNTEQRNERNIVFIGLKYELRRRSFVRSQTFIFRVFPVLLRHRRVSVCDECFRAYFSRLWMCVCFVSQFFIPFNLARTFVIHSQRSEYGERHTHCILKRWKINKPTTLTFGTRAQQPRNVKRTLALS